MFFTMNANGFQTNLVYDELKISAHENDGFNPYELFISSIVGCSGGVLRKVFQKMRLQINDINISVLVKRNEEEAYRIEQIHLTFTIYAENIARDIVDKAIKLARKNCSMIQSVQDSIQITESFELKSVSK